MAQTVSVIVTAAERARLATIVEDRSRPLKHVQRARIVLHSADRLPVLEVARRASVSRPAVWRWQRRYAEEGVHGLLHDKTRPPGTAPVPMTTVAKVLALTSAEPPGETTHWTRDGRRRGPLVADNPAHLGGAPAATPPTANLQALQGPRLRREGRGHR